MATRDDDDGVIACATVLADEINDILKKMAKIPSNTFRSEYLTWELYRNDLLDRVRQAQDRKFCRHLNNQPNGALQTARAARPAAGNNAENAQADSELESSIASIAAGLADLRLGLESNHGLLPLVANGPACKSETLKPHITAKEQKNPLSSNLNGNKGSLRGTWSWPDDTPLTPLDCDDLEDILGIEDERWSSFQEELLRICKEQEDTKCVACEDLFLPDDILDLPCGHDYCRTCVDSLFVNAITDESLFPPRCCRQEVDLAVAKTHLSPQTAASFVKKAAELSTQNRTYCAQPRCSAWIPLQSIQSQTGTCPDCGLKTCTECKASAHGGDCQKSEALDKLLETAKENGWQRCNKCKRLVELKYGCNHITCLCGAQFCYECGLTWKTCKCKQWDEQRLYARARVITGRANGGGEEQVADMAANLRARHECRHTAEWEYVHGPHHCEMCGHDMPVFILECPRCHLQLCRRCRFNRLRNDD